MSDAVARARTAANNLYATLRSMNEELIFLRSENAELKSKLASPRKLLVKQNRLDPSDIERFKSMLKTRLVSMENEIMARSLEGNTSTLSTTLNTAEFDELLANLIFMPEEV